MYPTYHDAGNVFIDTMTPNIVRLVFNSRKWLIFPSNNFFGLGTKSRMGSVLFCIDMDDGSSNYHVYNNVNVNCSIKFREGDYRVVENNIMYVIWRLIS